MSRFKAEQGYLAFAMGEVYLNCAYAQALSIKATQKINNYAVIVDAPTFELITDKHKKVFDQICVLNYNAIEWDMTQDWQAINVTPWRETIMLNADIIFTTSIDHWWDIMRVRDVCFTTKIKDFRHKEITSRAHRRLFDHNHLPNIYTALFYFRYSKTAATLFSYAREITENWEWVAKEFLIRNTDPRLRNDEVFAIAANIVGVEEVTLPHSVPTFVHCKAPLWDMTDQMPWYDQLYTEWDEQQLLIGHHPQFYPIHYHHKEWLTDDIIRRLERNYEKLYSSN